METMRFCEKKRLDGFYLQINGAHPGRHSSDALCSELLAEKSVETVRKEDSHKFSS
jgi:hypothetical protein